MGALFLLHLLVLSCYMALASGRVVERSPQSDQDSDFFHHYSDMLLDVRDEFSQHMFKLYEQYNRQHRLKEGNTVRGVNSIQGSGDQRMLFHLNLTSLQDSEVILSATFHFLFDHQPRHKPWHCKRPRRPSCRTLPVHPLPSITLLFHSVSPGSPGSLLGNMTLHPHRRGLWQMKDVTQVIKEARHKGHQFLCVELDLGQQYQRQPAEVLSIGSLPYVLLYADDQVLAEPNSVVASLQRYDPLTEDGHSSRSTLPYTANASPETKGRVTREAPLPFDPIQNNELPEVDDGPARYTKDSLWESTWHLALKPKSTILNKGSKKTHEGVSEVKGNGAHSKEEPQVLREEKANRQTLHSDGTTVMELSDKDFKSPVGPSAERRHQGRDGRKHKARAGGGIPESPVLSFDERTLRKVRRRQWGDSQHGGCSRRNLRVDFADIGWSEWVIAPKAFDAYYCAGTCGFPIPKVARPTNHATIQSIVRAVGIIPGVPEPCCVPEKMSPLAVLYHEEARNMVLKLYPNMSVQSCSCR